MKLKSTLQRPLFELKLNTPVAVAIVVVILYLGFSIITFLRPNPFLVAREKAQVLGNWEAEQVQLIRGHYQYSPFGSVVEADLRVLIPNENISAHIELRHSPLGGWTVRNFHAPEQDEPSGQAAIFVHSGRLN